VSEPRVVLVVDDSPDCAATLQLALAPLSGIEVRVTRSAEEAIAAAVSATIAAVITDIQLPGMTGLDLINQLRGQHGLSNLPVVVISGSTDHDASSRAISAGATAFFSKPFSPLAVRRKLEALIDEQ
jgi:CheY-like chemotaxis protein